MHKNNSSCRESLDIRARKLLNNENINEHDKGMYQDRPHVAQDFFTNKLVDYELDALTLVGVLTVLQCLSQSFGKSINLINM